jgi:hypothetical protein
MRLALTIPVRLALTILGLMLASPGFPAHAQEGERAGGKTFRAVLYFVPAGEGSGPAPGGAVRVEHLKEVLPAADDPSALAVWVEGGTPQRLQVVTVAPGQESSVVKYKDLTFRISGLYRGAQKERMFLRVSFDQGGQAAVKEFLAGLDQSVLVSYPLAGRPAGTFVAVLVPTG